MLVCSKCNKPARIGYKKLEDGRMVRFCHACREVVE
jgi:large subunit ribosomal protein L24